jgi:hypothetical protein
MSGPHSFKCRKLYFRSTLAVLAEIIYLIFLYRHILFLNIYLLSYRCYTNSGNIGFILSKLFYGYAQINFMRWPGYAIRMGMIRNACKVCLKNLKGRAYSEKIGLNGFIILTSGIQCIYKIQYLCRYVGITNIQHIFD